MKNLFWLAIAAGACGSPRTIDTGPTDSGVVAGTDAGTGAGLPTFAQFEGNSDGGAFVSLSCVHNLLTLQGVNLGAWTSLHVRRTLSPLDTLGTICGSAPDAGACFQAIDALPPDSFLVRGRAPGSTTRSSRVSVVATNASGPTLAGTSAALLSMLAPIDSEQEAAWVVAAFQNDHAVCNDTVGRARRTRDGGFQVLASWGDTCNGMLEPGWHQTLFQVDATGGVTQLADDQVSKGRLDCVE